MRLDAKSMAEAEPSLPGSHSFDPTKTRALGSGKRPVGVGGRKRGRLQDTGT